MAAVGRSGCGFEQQLESVRAALHDNIPENAGFLRDSALLVVVFVTDEDDGSASPDSTIYDKDHAEFGPMFSYERQTRFAVMCGHPPDFPPYGDSGGALSDCIPAPNPNGTGPGKQYDVQRYIDFFDKPIDQGGVKANPLDVVLVGIDGPEEPFEVVLSDPGYGPPEQTYKPCPAIDENAFPPCLPVLQHSCHTDGPTFITGDPAVRLNAVIRSVRNHQVLSICDPSKWGTALNVVGQTTLSQLGGGCFPYQLSPDADHPDCVVEDVTQNADGTTSTVQLRSCAAASHPCWRFEKTLYCDVLSPDGVAIRVDRDADVEYVTTRVTCAIPCQNPPAP